MSIRIVLIGKRSIVHFVPSGYRLLQLNSDASNMLRRLPFREWSVCGMRRWFLLPVAYGIATAVPARNLQVCNTSLCHVVYLYYSVSNASAMMQSQSQWCIQVHVVSFRLHVHDGRRLDTVRPWRNEQCEPHSVRHVPQRLRLLASERRPCALWQWDVQFGRRQPVPILSTWLPVSSDHRSPRPLRLGDIRTCCVD